MKVECKESSLEKWVDELSNLGYTAETQLDVVVGQIYRVYAMCLCGQVLLYLLEGASGWPIWYPAVLFETQDTAIPMSWQFKFLGRDRSNLIKAVWGFKELVEDSSYFDALSEQDNKAVALFRERKTAIDAE